jgi:hypothetical protein
VPFLRYCRTVVGGGGLPNVTGESCVIGCGGLSGSSDPAAAGGIDGPAESSEAGAAGTGIGRGPVSAVRTAFTATCRAGAGAALIGVPTFRLLMLCPRGIKFDVLAPGAGAAGTGPAPGSAAGGAMPPAGVMPFVG